MNNDCSSIQEEGDRFFSTLASTNEEIMVAMKCFALLVHRRPSQQDSCLFIAFNAIISILTVSVEHNHLLIGQPPPTVEPEH